MSNIMIIVQCRDGVARNWCVSIYIGFNTHSVIGNISAKSYKYVGLTI